MRGVIMKKIIILPIVIAIVLIAGGLGYYWGLYAPHEKAVDQFNSAKSNVESKNKDMQAAIDSADKLIDSKEEAYDLTTLDKLKSQDNNAKRVLVVIPNLPPKTKEINDATKKLQKAINYTTQISELKTAIQEYENSIKQLNQITKPKAEFIIERLREISSVTGVQAVTENNDPNGDLNKQGGYTDAVYFTDSEVKENIEGQDVVAKGNSAGGCIEVYATKDDAEKRSTYLSAFDGAGILNPGSHNVYGTVVIRTSEKLTATQQKELENQIVDKLTDLE